MRDARPSARSMIWLVLVATFAISSGVAPVDAEVVRVEVERRVDVLGGRAFGKAGAYELIDARILYAFDPLNPQKQGDRRSGARPRALLSTVWNVVNTRHQSGHDSWSLHVVYKVRPSRASSMGDSNPAVVNTLAW